MYNSSSATDHYYLESPSTYEPNLNPRKMANLSHELDVNDKDMITSKIMVVALVILFAVVIFVICLHVYARWIWRSTALEGGQRADPGPFSRLWRSWRRRISINISGRDIQTDTDADVLESTKLVVGLDKSTLEALPTFRFKIDANNQPVESTEYLIGVVECAICLGDFQDDEMGRTLPKCSHSFHLECIDMWLHSHSTCPLCRAILERHDEEALIQLPDVDVGTARRPEFRSGSTGRTSRRFRGNMREISDHTNIIISPQELVPDNQILDDDPTRAEQMLESLQPSTQHSAQEFEVEHDASKRTGSIPVNVLFWGNYHSHRPSRADYNSGFLTVVNTSVQAPFQVAIDIDTPSSTSQHQPLSLPLILSSNMPNASPPSDSVICDCLVSPTPRTSANVCRLLSRGRLPPVSAAAAAAATAEDAGGNARIALSP